MSAVSGTVETAWMFGGVGFRRKRTASYDKCFLDPLVATPGNTATGLCDLWSYSGSVWQKYAHQLLVLALLQPPPPSGRQIRVRIATLTLAVWCDLRNRHTDCTEENSAAAGYVGPRGSFHGTSWCGCCNTQSIQRTSLSHHSTASHTLGGTGQMRFQGSF